MTEKQNEQVTAEVDSVGGALIQPKRALGMSDAVALIVGIVIGAGIFRTPAIVAANTANSGMFLFAWILGGIVSLIGALCYAELTTAFPNTGGDYYFLRRAFGKKLAFLFAWARMSVIQTGSIALLAFIFGDYLSQVFDLGQFSSFIYASLVIVILTIINILGVRFGSGTQKLLTILEVSGILLIVIAGFFLAPANEVAALTEKESAAPSASLGMAMVVVLLTFGGWNEAAYISGELRSGQRHMAKALIYGIIIITVVYLLVNLAYLNVLGINGISKSSTVAGDLMNLALGKEGLLLIGILVAISALTSVNATIFTGARTGFALGRDFSLFSLLGKWNDKNSAPVNAFIVQGLISLALICLGLINRKGFETILEYTAPVFWFFFLLVGLALFILRRKEPGTKRPFKVPLYPLTPLLFCLTSTYLLYSSVVYTGSGALVGIAVLAVGALLLPFVKNRH